ncbi:ASCH domain-containing protein [Rhodococcus sp. IEGM 1370]|uniref:ASCH domain-containing protein n=1 Tax=Rhodococcus sp. IEGM 1370 TaxID=3082222 RepID=UPI0029541F1A|nr:ASCH domain-containing protein [Rhodococcus sp. IEGM 1370]MDV8076788.1 ASCH domain-containing protein [Rhodococcus sp. IEGM 1370]
MTDLPIVEFAYPGPLRDRLVAAVLSGEKTSTASLLIQYTEEELPRVGERGAVVDSAGVVVGVIETTGVDIVALKDVSLQHASTRVKDTSTWRTGEPGTKDSGTRPRFARNWVIHTSQSTTTLEWYWSDSYSFRNEADGGWGSMALASAKRSKKPRARVQNPGRFSEIRGGDGDEHRHALQAAQGLGCDGISPGNRYRAHLEGGVVLARDHPGALRGVRVEYSGRWLGVWAVSINPSSAQQNWG